MGVDSITSQPRLLRAVDHAKDQSYVLFGMPRQQLTRTLLPIGEFEKSRVRDLAREFGLPVADKPDSQEICFVPGNDYAGLVERRRPGAARPGDILDESGAVIGAHEGHHRFTIGQRRGVALALGQPVYVVAKDPARNTITVGPRERLLANGCTVNEANWLIDERELAARSGGDGSIPVFIRHRSTAPLIAARLTLGADGTDPTHSGRAGRFSVEFDEPLHSVTPGQALVVYDAQDPDWVLGGGWIEKPE